MEPDLQTYDMISERDQFIALCNKSRLYKNPNYKKPWNVFSSISKRLLNDVLALVENDFTSTIEKFVDNFLKLETSSF